MTHKIQNSIPMNDAFVISLEQCLHCLQK